MKTIGMMIVRMMRMTKKTIKVGTISGKDLLMNREGKAHKGDLMVSRGTGVHTPVSHKTKTKQKIKNEIRGYY